MAGKRGATSDLNHDNWDQEDEGEEAGQFTTASAEAMKGRVIKKAKRKGVANTKAEGPNLFSGFSFGAGKPAAASPVAAAKNSFAFLASASANPDSANGGKKDESNESSAKPPLTSSGFAGFAGFGGTPAAGGASAKWSCGTCMVPNDADKDACVCCETPKPGAKVAPKKSAFDAPKAKVDGFSISAGGGFKFGGAAAGNQPPPSSGFNFGNAAPTASKPATSMASGFKFGAGTTTTTSYPSAAPKSSPVSGFKFDSNTSGASSVKFPEEYCRRVKALNQQVSAWIKEHVDSNPLCILTPVFADYAKHLADLDQYKNASSSISSEPSKPATTPAAVTPMFGSNAASSSSSNKPLLGAVFGAPAAKKKEEEEETEVCTVDDDSDEDAQDEEDEEEEEEEDEENEDEEEKVDTKAAAAAFSFAAPAKTGSETEKKDGGLFSFGSKNTAAAPAPSSGFSFGSSAAGGGGASKGFSFGSTGSSDAKPAASSGFSFGSTAGSDAAKATTGFSFGSSSSASKEGSGFSFGDAKPSAGFSFGSSANFSFGNAAAASQSAGAQKEEDEDEEPPKVEVNTVAEDGAFHSVRCKLYYKAEGGFKEKGLGMLHLKKIEDGKKVQMIVRAETNLGNILLNVMVNDKMNATPRGNNVQLVCIPNPAIKGVEGPVSMLIKVKTADLAADLVKNLNA